MNETENFTPTQMNDESWRSIFTRVCCLQTLLVHKVKNFNEFMILSKQIFMNGISRKNIL